MALIALPVIVSLMNNRQDTIIFDKHILCGIWAVLFYFLKRVCAILVMIVTLTRTIATVFPFRTLRIRWFSVAVSIYAVFICVVDVVFLSTGWFKARYRKKESMCEIYQNRFKSDRILTGVYSIVLQIELLLPVVIIIFNFLICTVTLARQRTEFRIGKTKQFRRVTVTIALFAFLFLVCNLPAFMVQLDYLVSAYSTREKYMKDHRKGLLTGWYAHLLSHFLLTLINVALNPCLYLLRMSEFRGWLVKKKDDPRRRRNGETGRKSLRSMRQRDSTLMSFSTSVSSFASQVYIRVSRMSVITMQMMQ